MVLNLFPVLPHFVGYVNIVKIYYIVKEFIRVNYGFNSERVRRTRYNFLRFFT